MIIYFDENISEIEIQGDESDVSDSEHSESDNQSSELSLDDGCQNAIQNLANISCFNVVALGIVAGCILGKAFIEGIWSFMR